MNHEKSHDNDIEFYLEMHGFNETSVSEGRLMLLELMLKAGSRYYNSHTEEAFLRSMNVLKSDRTLNFKGRGFAMRMCYAPSNKRAPVYELIKQHRNK